jgi:P27 family predicted phage terminase small subunit
VPSPKPRPTSLRLLEGRSEGRDSGGRPVAEVPAFRRIPPTKPADLSADASLLWDSIVDELARVQVLKPVDAAALQMACETYARWCEARRLRVENGILATNSQGQVRAPWVAIEEQAGKDYRAWCAEFGLTPSAELRLAGAAKGANDGGDENPFA